uniref:Tail assembly chaperone n=2 Tax=unclassified bacterial viruses TaxID=12333 RepID=A0AAU7J814_9VIRU
MPVSGFLDFVYYLLTRNADEQAVEKFRRNLWMPPKGVVPDARSPWSAENETAAFRAVKAMVTGQAPTVDATGRS